MDTTDITTCVWNSWKGIVMGGEEKPITSAAPIRLPMSLVLMGVSMSLLILFLILLVLLCKYFFSDKINTWLLHWVVAARRQSLPRLVILVRHGESQANVDKRIWRALPDNLVRLTVAGQRQAVAAGRRIRRLLEQEEQQSGPPYRRIHLVVSPFERALQTAAGLRLALESRIFRTDIESRIREQEMGNIQNDDFAQYRKQQQRVGRFWYRFQTGESGADVHDRVKSWWSDSVLTVNERHGFAPVDAMVVVTHGITIRFILMQLFGWSPTTFHSIWNAGNCDLYVLKRDLSKPGTSPYVLDPVHGDMPRSSIDVMVQLKATSKESKSPSQPIQLRLQNYLSVPPPRTTRLSLVAQMLAEQYPEQIPQASDITHILFMPFIQTTTMDDDNIDASKNVMIQGRSTSGSALDPSRHESATSAQWGMCDLAKTMNASAGCVNDSDCHDPDGDNVEDDNAHGGIRYAKPEISLRFPCILPPKEGETMSLHTTTTTTTTAADDAPTSPTAPTNENEHKTDPPPSTVSKQPSVAHEHEALGELLFPWWPWDTKQP